MSENIQPLLSRLRSHILNMAPHQKERNAGKLLIECKSELTRLYEENRRLTDALLESDNALRL